jgi:hypothetical protein
MRTVCITIITHGYSITHHTSLHTSCIVVCIASLCSASFVFSDSSLALRCDACLSNTLCSAYTAHSIAQHRVYDRQQLLATVHSVLVHYAL